MKITPVLPLLAVLAAAPFLTTNCAHVEKQAPGGPASPGTFASVRPVIENTCVHCHGKDRLPSMVPFNNTKSLALIIGPGKWISPGHPETSRFFQVVTLKDNQVGAMPPTGHALSKGDVELLRAWIKAGAVLPEGNVRLTPHGEAPRSR